MPGEDRRAPRPLAAAPPSPAAMEAAADALFALAATEQDDAGPEDAEPCDDLGTCTTSARALAAQFRGCVVGYWIEQNPGAVLGRDEGGHDFALIGSHYLVDAWGKHVDGTLPRAVWDLRDPADRAEIDRLFGAPAHWVLGEDFRQPPGSSPFRIGSRSMPTLQTRRADRTRPAAAQSPTSLDACGPYRRRPVSGRHRRNRMEQQRPKKIAGVVIGPVLHDPDAIDRIRRRAVYRKQVPVGQYQRDVLTLLQQIAAREAQLTGRLAAPMGAAPMGAAPAEAATEAASHVSLAEPAPVTAARPRVEDAGTRCESILAALDRLHRSTTPENGGIGT